MKRAFTSAGPNASLYLHLLIRTSRARILHLSFSLFLSLSSNLPRHQIFVSSTFVVQRQIKSVLLILDIRYINLSLTHSLLTLAHPTHQKHKHTIVPPLKMKSFAALALPALSLIAGVQATWSNETVWTTLTVQTLTTYCPEATTFTHG